MDILIGGAVFGLGFGIVNVMQNYMIQVGAEPHLRQRLFSGLHANYAAAAILVPIVANLMNDLGWHLVFLAMGTLPLIVVFFSFFIGDSSDHYRKLTERNPLPKNIFWQAVVVSIAFAFYLNAELSLSTRLVHFLETELGYAKSYANYHFLGFFVGMFLGRVAIAKYNISIRPLIMILISSLLSCLSVLSMLYLEPWSVVASGVFFGPVFPFYLEYLSRKFDHYADRVLSLALSISALGVVIMHTVVGYLSDTMSIGQALLVGPVGLLIFALLMGFHDRQYKPVSSV